MFVAKLNSVIFFITFYLNPSPTHGQCHGLCGTLDFPSTKYIAPIPSIYLDNQLLFQEHNDLGSITGIDTTLQALSNCARYPPMMMCTRYNLMWKQCLTCRIYVVSRVYYTIKTDSLHNDKGVWVRYVFSGVRFFYEYKFLWHEKSVLFILKISPKIAS